MVSSVPVTHTGRPACSSGHPRAVRVVNPAACQSQPGSRRQCHMPWLPAPPKGLLPSPVQARVTTHSNHNGQPAGPAAPWQLPRAAVMSLFPQHAPEEAKRLPPEERPVPNCPALWQRPAGGTRPLPIVTTALSAITQGCLAQREEGVTHVSSPRTWPGGDKYLLLPL